MNTFKRMFMIVETLALVAFFIAGTARAADVCYDACFELTARGEFRSCMEKCNLLNTGVNVDVELQKAGLKCPVDMAFIPAGEFTMGCNHADGECRGDESPARNVKITKGFCMDKYEVTQAGYKRMMWKNPSSNVLLCGDTCPVESVTWNNAKYYCEFVHKRLPTEAEWEYAARGGADTRFYWGDKPEFAGEFAWFEPSSLRRTHPVGKKLPNKFGLYDMLGNVWEWVEDCYGADWLNDMPENDPFNYSADCMNHVSRGDAWTSYSVSLSRRFRDYYNDGDQGFRCAWSFPPIKK